MAFNIRRRPFGATSPINPPQIMHQRAPQMGGAPMNEPQPEQPKFGGWGDKLYAIGGLLQGDGGAAVGRYHAMGDQQAMMQQQAAAEAAAAQRKRAMDLADYETKQQIAARYDRPAIEQNAEYIERTEGPEAAARYRQNYGQRPQEPRMVQLPDGRTVFGTMDEIMRLFGGQSDATEDDWNSAQPMGGAGGNASGGFPR